MHKIYAEFLYEEWELLRGMIRELETLCEFSINNLADEEMAIKLRKRLDEIYSIASTLSVQDMINMDCLTKINHSSYVMREYYEELDKKEV